LQTRPQRFRHAALTALELDVACGAGMGSVSQIGWEWYSRLSATCRVTLLTHARNRAALAAAGARLGDSRIIFIDTEWFAGPLYRLALWCFPRSEHPRFLIASLDFFVYDWIARQQLESGPAFDIVHAVMPVSPLAATSLHKLGIPLVLGPWNGGQTSPTAFPEIMKAESKWLYPVRNMGRVFDAVIGSTRNAAMIFTAVIAIDFGGPAEIVDDGVGVKLPATGKADVVRGLVKALASVREQPERWQMRGLEGRRRVETQYSWDAKIAEAIRFYRQLLEAKS
jgi:hypothetical protein